MTDHRALKLRTMQLWSVLALVLALSFGAAPALSQIEEVQTVSPVIAAECAPVAADHAINTKGAGSGDRQATAEPATPCVAPPEPVTVDHAIHPACQKAADKIACNRFEDYKATHKDD